MVAVNRRLSAIGQYRPVDLAGREWGMEEEANLDALDTIVPVERVIFRLDAVRDICELVCRKPRPWSSRGLVGGRLRRSACWLYGRLANSPRQNSFLRGGSETRAIGWSLRSR